MELGIFLKVFERQTLADRAQAARASGFSNVHFDFALTHGQTLPLDLADTAVTEISDTLAAAGLQICSVEATYNMAHPDPSVRQEGTRALARLIPFIPQLGTDLLGICTGSRDDDMWTRHPENGSDTAWKDLRSSVTVVTEVAEAHNVKLCIECEYNNVVDTAARARRLIDEIGSSSLAVTLDAANLIPPGRLGDQRRLLSEAFDLLAPNIVLAHAKDVLDDGTFVAAGSGGVDYGLFADLLVDYEFGGALVLHGLTEEELPQSRDFVQHAIADAGSNVRNTSR